MIELYEKGTADIKKKKDRTKEEMEVEKQMNECTFHPNIKYDLKIPEAKFSNDIYKEKEYKDLYERLKRGRMERKVKNSAYDRYGLDKDLKNFVKQNKENKNKEYLEEEKIQEEYVDENNNNNNNIKNNKINKVEKDENSNQNNSPNKNEEDNYNNSLEQSSEEDGEKKEGIPLLIIDVNIA